MMDQEQRAKLLAAVRQFTDTVEVTGGLIHHDDGTVAPASDPDWIDLGEAYKAVCEAIGREPMVPEDMDCYAMTDQPPTCPKCGRRITVWLTGETCDKQVVRCEPCNYNYRLEEDTDEQEDDGND